MIRKDSRIKNQLTRISPLSVGLVLLFAAMMSYLLFTTFAASGTATIYTSPGGTQSVVNGQVFTVNVRVSSPGNAPVTGAAVYLSYPTSKLQLQSKSYSGSPYNTQLAESDSNGVLRMDRAAFPMVSGGDQLFAQVTFKAIATGSASISFTNSSIVTSGEDDSNILSAKTGVTYNVTESTSTTPPASSGGGSTSSPSSSTGSTKPSTGAGNSSNSSPADPSSNQSGGQGATDTDSSAADTSSSENGTSNDDSTKTVFQVLVVDKQNKPVQGAEVTVDGKTVKTDVNGIAKFEGVSTGKKSIVVNYQGRKKITDAEVKSLSSTDPSSIKVSVDSNRFNPIIWAIPPLIGMVIAVSIFVIRPWVFRLIDSRNINNASASGPQPEVSETIRFSESAQPGNKFTPNNSASGAGSDKTDQRSSTDSKPS